MGHIVCDKRKCVGCLACVIACIDQHYPETNASAVSGRIHEKVFSEQTGMCCYMTRSCLHCAEPKCVEVCPNQALTKDEHDLVRLNQENCVK